MIVIWTSRAVTGYGTFRFCAFGGIFLEFVTETELRKIDFKIRLVYRLMNHSSEFLFWRLSLFDDFNQHVCSMIVLSTSVIKLTATLPGLNNLKSDVLYRDGMSVQRNLSVKPQRQVVCSHLSPNRAMYRVFA